MKYQIEMDIFTSFHTAGCFKSIFLVQVFGNITHLWCKVEKDSKRKDVNLFDVKDIYTTLGHCAKLLILYKVCNTHHSEKCVQIKSFNMK